MCDSPRLNFLNLLSIAVLIASHGSLAQDRQLEEVIVTSSPIKQSEMASIEAKRFAVNVLDAVSARVWRGQPTVQLPVLATFYFEECVNGGGRVFMPPGKHLFLVHRPQACSL